MDANHEERYKDADEIKEEVYFLIFNWVMTVTKTDCVNAEYLLNRAEEFISDKTKQFDTCSNNCTTTFVFHSK